jgi:hypothetical protein
MKVRKKSGRESNSPDSRLLPHADDGASVPFVIVREDTSALSQHVLETYHSRKFDILKHMIVD